MKRLLVIILIVVAVLVAGLGLAITLGGPGKGGTAKPNINDPFKNVDFSIYRNSAISRLAMAQRLPSGRTDSRRRDQRQCRAGAWLLRQ